MRRKSHDAPMR